MKLEWLLVILIGLTTAVTMTTKLSDKAPTAVQADKELEFTDTTFTEVTTQKREGVAFTTHGIRAGGVLKVEKLRYHNDSIRLLLADHGTYRGDIIFLDGNVSVHQKRGYDYFTEHAKYDKRKDILYVTSRFAACIRRNVMMGSRFEYDLQKKIAYGDAIDAVIYTQPQDRPTFTCKDARLKLKKG